MKDWKFNSPIEYDREIDRKLKRMKIIIQKLEVLRDSKSTAKDIINALVHEGMKLSTEIDNLQKERSELLQSWIDLVFAKLDDLQTLNDSLKKYCKGFHWGCDMCPGCGECTIEHTDANKKCSCCEEYFIKACSGSDEDLKTMLDLEKEEIK